MLEADDAKLLTEVGFVAAARGDVARADLIFGALRMLRPGQAYPLVGLAVARLNAGQAGEAVTLLEQACRGNIDDRELLQAWRGFALQLDGKAAQSMRVLSEAAQGHGPGARLARGLLGQAGDTDDAGSDAGIDLQRS
ncbi:MULTISPECIES: hypothetical protein [Achromobacter]|uniref:hypothetical protein n=1 Tax=Achromobacter TaxID=222 RepID=UPI0006C42A84|nr:MULTISPECIES: hypothetical protein [Achromobacter]MCG2598824.1 hypothetical protein [Achromobacter sp.]MCG2603605.1 hypothetical protein [Achromobacter sp.]CAB3873363.1 hypothetical protein LMG26846_03115 [Achromobacter insuavis]CUJ44947.1 Uncharacterised protein [Achromobacter sp. 2789STDY5608621]